MLISRLLISNPPPNLGEKNIKTHPELAELRRSSDIFLWFLSANSSFSKVLFETSVFLASNVRFGASTNVLFESSNVLLAVSNVEFGLFLLKVELYLTLSLVLSKVRFSSGFEFRLVLNVLFNPCSEPRAASTVSKVWLSTEVSGLPIGTDPLINQFICCHK